jgi:hypothetical protein
MGLHINSVSKMLLKIINHRIKNLYLFLKYILIDLIAIISKSNHPHGEVARELWSSILNVFGGVG